MLPDTEHPSVAEELKRRILASGPVPRHIAVIMDGNGRWAKQRHRPRIFGHLQGRHSVREVVIACRELGVEVLTLYTFSVENWQRPATEIKALMRILQRTLREQREELRENGIRLAVIGRPADLPGPVQRSLVETQEFLADGKEMLLNLALSYGGRREIAEAAVRMAREVKEGKLDPETIDESTIGDRLYTAGLPDPDLLIRTSGEFRISNFLLWQLAYTEIWLTEVHWPDFDRTHLYEAVLDFQRRERRFGRVR